MTIAAASALYTSDSQTSLSLRFWSKVDKGEDDCCACWLWTGFRAPYNGYGKIKVGGKRGLAAQAHRVSWELHFGAIPAGMTVHHRCDVPACVRPDHLRVGTHAENMEDMARKGRQRRSLSDEQVRLVRSSTSSASQLACSLGVLLSTVLRVRSGETYRRVA